MSLLNDPNVPRLRLLKPIVMVGMMGAGKTAIGCGLAVRLNVPFKDSDAELEMAASRTIAEIFERDGEAFFRAREGEVIARLLNEDPCVLSTGGGAFLSDGNRDIIEAQAVSVWLKADIGLLWSRVRHKTTRPLLRTADPKATLTEIANARNPIYAKATLAVEAQAEFSIEDMVEKVLGALIEAGIVKEET
jgi:shikimate kinase